MAGGCTHRRMSMGLVITRCRYRKLSRAKDFILIHLKFFDLLI